MTAERARLARLRRLESVRAHAKRAAALDAAQAEATLARMDGLAARTRALAADYAGCAAAEDGGAMLQRGRFVGELQRLHELALRDAAAARAAADRQLAALALAERRRAAVEERAAEQARRLAALRRPAPQLDARRSVGTDLE